MSLQVCPACKKTQSYRSTYREINKTRFAKPIICPYCNHKSKVQWTKRSFLGHILSCIAWMLPAIIVIYLSVTGKISFVSAIGIVVVFHFAAMYGLIKYMTYKG